MKQSHNNTHTRAGGSNRATVRLLLLIAGLALLAGAGGALFLYQGLYNVSALAQHTRPVFWLADTARIYSVAGRAEDIRVPDLDTDGWRRSGMALYLEHCELCHGGPGVAPEQFALGMQPLPTSIVGIARKRQEKPAEMYWVIENGIKMTGMPAWKYRLSETEIWQLVAFLEELPYLDSAQYRSLRESLPQASAPASRNDTSRRDAVETGPELIARGREAIQQYGCTACHRIPGITAAVNTVGPPLHDFAQRRFIAGVLPNTPENMVRWLRFPRQVSPDTTMPDLGVRQADAVAISAYLEAGGE